MDLMNCVCTFHKFYEKYLKGPVKGNFYVQFLQKPSSKFQIFHYMKTGIQYMEVNENVEPAFLKNHRRKLSEILHSGLN